MNEQQLNHLILTAQCLGTCFYHAPESAPMQPILAFFQQEAWQKEWICPENRKISALFHFPFEIEKLSEEYQTLFIGPHHLVAPPWGSVYLDPEEVIFGDSLLRLQQFLQQQEILFEGQDKEPTDHIGLMFFLIAYLAKERPTLVEILIKDHFYPWVFAYLAKLKQQTISAFYRDLAVLAEETLNAWEIK